MTGEENWYIIFCKEEKKEILDNMRGRSRKRSIRNVREKALLAAILAGAAFMMIFLFVGLKNRTSKGKMQGLAMRNMPTHWGKRMETKPSYGTARAILANLAGRNKSSLLI